ncbi:MAG: hypothetical protein ACQETE_16025 [Bacteroidota bacterium]
MVAQTSWSQQITIAALDDRGPFEYEIAGHQIRLQGNEFQFMDSDTSFSGTPIDLSDNSHFAGFAQRDPSNVIHIFNAGGFLVQQISGINLALDDESAAIYMHNDGSMAVRKNIASFEFYSSTGKLMQAASNSSGSKLGESMSEYAANPAGTTQLAYIPRVNFENSSGSNLNRYNGNDLAYLWNDTERMLSVVEVSPTGRLIALTVTAEGEEDKVEIIDRYGNKLRSYESRNPVIDITISDDDRYLMIRSQNRVAVHDLVMDERVGSSSFRGNPLLFASYVPADEMIVGLTGKWDESTGLVSQLEVRGVHLGKRSIASAEFEGGAVTRHQVIPWDLKRVGNYRYIIEGTNRTLEIRGRY